MRKRRKTLVIVGGVVLVLAALFSIGLSLWQVSRPMPGSTKQKSELAPQEGIVESQTNVAAMNPALQQEFDAFRNEITHVRGEYSKVKEELSTARREVARLQGTVDQMSQSNGAVLQAALMGNKPTGGSSSTPVVIMAGAEKGGAEPQPINLDSAVFRAAVQEVVTDALLSVHLPESTSGEQLALFKKALQKAVEQLFIDNKDPLPPGVTLRTAFARNTKMDGLESRVKTNETEAGLVSAALHKEQNGLYAKVAKESDVIAAQKTADDVTASLNDFKKLVYTKEEIEAIKKGINDSIDGVKGDVAVSELNIKNLGVSLAYCIWGHEYPKKREHARGILYLIFGPDFRIEQIKKAKDHAKKMTLPYQPELPTESP